MKLVSLLRYAFDDFQPPSGGCVLKQSYISTGPRHRQPAAFGRLCVETGLRFEFISCGLPAAFGRLCVETISDLTA